MNIKEQFQREFGAEPQIVVKAPGRVNLIGEHTDYNGGFVLPVAIERFVTVAARRRKDKRCLIYSSNYNQRTSFSLENPEFDHRIAWSNYLRGVVDILIKAGYNLSGLEAVILGNVPEKAGLSSSAALEVSFASALSGLHNLAILPPKLALLCQKAENEFVGVECGIMDQFTAVLGRKGNALFLDCRSLLYRLVPLKLGSGRLVIGDTGVKRALVSSEYNQRRKQCDEAVGIFRKFRPETRSLRDVSVADLGKWGKSLPPVILRRCRHVVSENNRVLKAVDFLKKGKIESFGALLSESHKSLRDDYEVSCPELDLLVEIALAQKGVLGARMTGAGFGGCTVNLVEEESLEDFKKAVEVNYFRKSKLRPRFYVFDPADGVRVEKVSARRTS